MDRYLIRKDKPTITEQAQHPKKKPIGKWKSSLSELKLYQKSNITTQAPLQSNSVSRINRIIDSTLSDPSNPITHNDGYQRAQHFVSSSTGHQQSNGRVHSSWKSTRVSKLKAQSKSAESDVLKNVIIYINGYTGSKVTNQELIELIQKSGGQTRPILSAICTHVITSMPLSAKKIEAEIQRKRGGKLKIVRPEWVIDSIDQGKRLSEWKYPVLEFENQKRISSVFQNTVGS